MNETDKTTNTDLKQDIITVLGMNSENFSEIEEDEDSGTTDTPAPTV